MSKAIKFKIYIKSYLLKFLISNAYTEYLSSISRKSRLEDTRSGTVRLTHVPTGIHLEAAIPEGNYSRKQMTAKRESLVKQLFPKLEAKVAQFLRIPGR